MMDTSSLNILIGGAIGVSGVLAGSIVNAVANYKNAQIQSEREQRKLRLSKLEELFKLLLEFSGMSVDFGIKISQFSVVKPSVEQFNEMVGFFGQTSNQISTMVCFYAPALLEKTGQMTVLAKNFQVYGISILGIQPVDQSALTDKTMELQASISLLGLGVKDLADSMNGNLKSGKKEKTFLKWILHTKAK